jgi:hypothetical protein
MLLGGALLCAQNSAEELVQPTIAQTAEAKPSGQAAKQEPKEDPDGLDDFGLDLPILYDSLRPYPAPGAKPSKWFEKLSIRGYAQFRFDRTVHENDQSAAPNLFGDRGINGRA